MFQYRNWEKLKNITVLHYWVAVIDSITVANQESYGTACTYGQVFLEIYTWVFFFNSILYKQATTLYRACVHRDVNRTVPLLFLSVYFGSQCVFYADKLNLHSSDIFMPHVAALAGPDGGAAGLTRDSASLHDEIVVHAIFVR